MTEMHWSGGQLPLEELVEHYRLRERAQARAALRVLGRHLAADVRAGRYPVAVLAHWDQWAAAPGAAELALDAIRAAYDAGPTDRPG